MADEQLHYSSPFINQYVRVPERISDRVDADHSGEYESVRHCVGLIAVNLLASGKFAYSRNNHHYTENHTKHYTYANMMKAVKIALADGYAVELQKGYWDRAYEKGLSSTLGSGPRLEELGQPAELELDVESLPLLVVDDRPVFSSRDATHLAANPAMLSSESCDLIPRLHDLCEEALSLNRDYWNKLAVGKHRLTLGQRCMGRVGLTRKFKKGGVGRWFQSGGLSYQELHKEDRAKLHINLGAVAELDYHAMHPHILYAWANQQCPDDFYERVANLCDCPRSAVKELVLIAVNASSYKSLSSAVNSTQRRDAESSLYSQLKELGLMARDVVGAIVQAHPLLERYVFTTQANRLMLAESDIMSSVLLKLMGLGIPALPIHDSVVVPARHEATVKRLMVDEYRRHMSFDIAVG